MPVPYKITPSGARVRTVKDLLADPQIRAEIKRTSEMFERLQKRQAEKAAAKKAADG